MTSLPSSVSSPPPDLSDTDKLSDIEVEELYFDTRDELRDAARKLWDAASRLDRDTGKNGGPPADLLINQGV